jgi:hypothetical protein
MSLVPARFTFTIYPGATFYKRIFFEVEGVLQPLTEHKVTLWIKDQINGTTLLKVDSEKDPEAVKLGNGTIDLTITDKETAEITWTEGVYELLVTDETLVPDRTDLILRGGFKVVPF